MRSYLWPLVATLLLQSVAAGVLFAVAVLAPMIAPDLGVDPSRIGFYTSLVFLGAALGSLLSHGPISRFGPLRSCQLGIILSALALLLPISHSWSLTLLGGVILGIGYAPFTPGTSAILAAVTTRRDRAFVFSAKQAGAPLGGMLTGALLPAIAVAYGWSIALIIVFLCALIAIVLVEPLRLQTDSGRNISGDHPVISIKAIPNNSQVWVLIGASFAFAAAQMCMFAFLVTDLVQRLGMNLIFAGFAFSAMQIGGVIARLLWGFIADRWVSSRIVLGFLGIGGGLAIAATAFFNTDWPFFAIVGVTTLVGATAAGWQGVFIAEVIRTVSSEDIGPVVGATMFFTYGGLVAGPILFGSVLLGLDSYPIAFLTLSALIFIAGIGLLSMSPSLSEDS